MTTDRKHLARRTWLSVAGVIAAAGLVHGAERTPPENLRALGGLWKLEEGDSPVYWYQDGDALVDLFSQHQSDSNNDGIPNLKLSHDDRFLICQSQGYPNHRTAVYPNASNPNSIQVQDFTFRLPLAPRKADRITRLPMGPIGMALNGVVFFNPFEQGGMNAVEGYSEIWLDSCCGHPQQHGVYHYHKYPTCVRSPFKDDGKRHSPPIGFAWDGFPVYGPWEADSQKAMDLTGDAALDVCNGHEDAARGYHYHATPGKFPYIIGGYHGVPEPSNSRQLGRGAREGAIENNAEGETQLGKTIVRVTPGNAQRGQTHRVRMELDLKLARQWDVPNDAPSAAQIGPFVGSNIRRDGKVVEFDIELPADADAGVLHDCHLEFTIRGRGGPVVLKKNAVFRATGEE